MTTVYNDSVETTMKIGEKEWNPAEVRVELSQVDTPNYVDINKMIPGEGVQVPSPPDKGEEGLIGKKFELHADNNLISERTSDKSEETLLFKGKLANISAIGTRAYEGIAYDPSQQPLASPGEKSAFGGNGSVLNQEIYVKSPYYGVLFMYSRDRGMEYEPKTVKAKKLAQKIVNEIPGVTDSEIQITDDGVTREGKSGSVTGAYNRKLKFDSTKITIQQAVTKIREEAECDWWFDKKGKLYFGVPEPVAHELKFITDASDGMTTPPYQSVKVIGSGVATEEGWRKKQLVADERIVVEGTWSDNKDFVKGEKVEPQFVYRNAEISTEAQAISSAKKIIEDLKKQSASGKISVVGFPEITPFDAVVMPQSSNKEGDNYQKGMPMGGSRYGIYKVIHKLNGSDGFKTELEVAGLTGSARIAVKPNNETFLIDRGDWERMSPRQQAIMQGQDVEGRVGPSRQ